MKRPRTSALLSVRESSLRYSRSPRTIPYQTLITPPVTIAMPWPPDTRASPARVFGLVVTRHLFAGALQLYSGMRRGRPISVAGGTTKAITDGCAALHHGAILPAHLLRERFRTTIRFIALFMITAWRARNPNTRS